jgi:predicted DNA-binding transcriptional regulator YafY
MNRTDRLLAIVLELERKGHQRAEDLAATFEVSIRTIYRDMQALSEAGVPIVAVTNQGYSLPEGYFLPPLHFTGDEALMLALGSQFMAQNFDAQYRMAADSAYRKIDAVLPRKLRDDVNYFQKHIMIFATSPLRTTQLEHLRHLRRAIVEQRRVRLHYTKKYAETDESGALDRDVDPYSLARLADDWLLMGYCHLRQDIRVFRLSRIDRLEVLDKTFQRPRNFRPDWIRPDEDRPIVVRALFDLVAARWVLEALPYAATAQEMTSEGLLVTLRVRHERDLVQWLLGWGSHICRIEPESLRLMLRKEAEQMLERLI